ncbi:uncharacterized protein LOC141674011 [Apium graveolens]|uniref:uncharacterized protein LOC141674011 n=1 Tax=Apium graveolens TaxID=4045 RepID=UPI003D7A532C
MGSYSILSASSSMEVSNFQSLLESLTPVVQLRPVPADCIQIFDEELNPSGMPITEYFFLKDIWCSLEECSAYGQGTLVKLANGERVTQYFSPHLSAIHLVTKKRVDQMKDRTVINRSTKATKSLSDGKSDDLLRSSNNISGTNDKLRDLSIGESSRNDKEGCKEACLSDSFFKFYDTKKQFDKGPLFSKMQELAQIYPDLKTLRSIDLSPASWMAIVWSPIYHIPNDGAQIQDFSASFISFHKLSSFRQDDASVDSSRNGTGRAPMPLQPFALATKNLTGDVWFNIASDKERSRKNEIPALALAISEIKSRRAITRHVKFKEVYYIRLVVELQEMKEIERKLEQELRETITERKKDHERIDELWAKKETLTEQVWKARA